MKTYFFLFSDTLVVTTLDTCTSMAAGVIIFGILGNLAFVTGNTDITQVVQGGTGLAFVSYPDAISKFEFAPQVFAAVFFFMLFVLGIGTNVGMSSCLMTAIRDRFTALKHWQVAVAIAVVQFSVGIMYLTPVGYMQVIRCNANVLKVFFVLSIIRVVSIC